MINFGYILTLPKQRRQLHHRPWSFNITPHSYNQQQACNEIHQTFINSSGVHDLLLCRQITVTPTITDFKTENFFIGNNIDYILYKVGFSHILIHSSHLLKLVSLNPINEF